MFIEVIAIGDEILKGIIVNTNAAFIGKTLMRLGYSTLRHTVLPDALHLLRAGLKEALSRSTLVIATGGLGPTCDDLTQEAAAKLFSSTPRLLPNRVGSAEGLVFSEAGKMLILLPGVPQEMRPMLEEEVVPLLQQYLPLKKLLLTEMIHFGPLSENLVDPIVRALKSDFPEVEFGIYPGYGVLNVRVSSVNAKEIAACKKKLEETFADRLFFDREGKIEHAVHEILTKRKFKLACAESCTGGQLAAKITSIPGASAYFVASLVTYSDAMKQKLLGVKQETLDRFGAVSKECVLEMAEGLLERTEADLSVAISGIAGPDGGTKEKPVGTVWLAIAQKGNPSEALLLQLKGNRETITLWATQEALFHLWKKVSR